MATITLQKNEIQTNGNLPAVGEQAIDFELAKTDLSNVKLSDFLGTRLILNIFPSVDTGVCAASVRVFNQKAADLSNTKVLCISKDLPFAQNRFCGAEGIDQVVNLSDFRDGSFGKNYGLEIKEGPMKGLHSRVVIIIDEEGKVIYTEQVQEITEEPDYDAALAVLS